MKEASDRSLGRDALYNMITVVPVFKYEHDSVSFLELFVHVHLQFSCPLTQNAIVVAKFLGGFEGSQHLKCLC